MNSAKAPLFKAKFRLDYGVFKLEVDLNLPNSGITVLFGDSGSGKTTLLRCIAGLQRPQQGRLEINGNVWQDSDKDVFLPTHQRSLGYVFQEANLFPHLTVLGNLQFGLKRLGSSSNLPLEPILDMLGIQHLLERMPEKLSGGERQRVAIARALVLNPEVLLMDEPLASLDAKRKQEFMPFLLKIQQQARIPILYVTHSVEEVAQLADYLVLLERGQVVASGLVPDILSRIDIPLAHGKDAGVVWDMQVARHEAEYYLTLAAFEEGYLSLPIINAPVGTRLRVQIYARDVSITLEQPVTTSILNVLPATITGIVDDLTGRCVVQLQVGNYNLLSHITQKSATLLKLTIGLAVYVQIKGTSIVN